MFPRMEDAGRTGVACSAAEMLYLWGEGEAAACFIAGGGDNTCEGCTCCGDTAARMAAAVAVNALVDAAPVVVATLLIGIGLYAA